LYIVIKCVYNYIVINAVTEIMTSPSPSTSSGKSGKAKRTRMTNFTMTEKEVLVDEAILVKDQLEMKFNPGMTGPKKGKCWDMILEK
jgi:hypothetical protein